MFDLALLGIIALSTLIAFFRGLIHSLVSLLIWAGSFAITFFAFGPVTDLVGPKMDFKPAIENAAIGLGLFIVVFIVLAVFLGMAAKSLHDKAGGFVDKFLGLVFGAARGVIFSSIIFIVFQLGCQFLHAAPKWFVESKTYPFFKTVHHEVVQLLPEDMQKRFAEDETGGNSLSRRLFERSEEEESEASKKLTPESSDLLQNMISFLPEEKVSVIAEMLNASNMSPDTLDLNAFQKILDAYKATEKEGEIPISERLSPKQLDAVESELKTLKNNSSSGYKSDMMKQLERLTGGAN